MTVKINRLNFILSFSFLYELPYRSENMYLFNKSTKYVYEFNTETFRSS